MSIIKSKKYENNLMYEITSSTCHNEIIIEILRSIITSDLIHVISEKCISYFEDYMNYLSVGPWTYRIESSEKIKKIIEAKPNKSSKDYNICASNINPLNEIDKNILNNGPYMYQGNKFSVMINKYKTQGKISLAIAVVEKINNTAKIKYTFCIKPKSNNLCNVYVHTCFGNKKEIINKFYIMPFGMSSNYWYGHYNIKEEIAKSYSIYSKLKNIKKLPCSDNLV